jgi:hypothetical protein
MQDVIAMIFEQSQYYNIGERLELHISGKFTITMASKIHSTESDWPEQSGIGCIGSTVEMEKGNL